MNILKSAHGPGQRTFLGFILIGFLLAQLPVQRLDAQESILSSYERNFIRASLTAKSGVLRDASTDERAGDFIGALYETALQFALTNGIFLRDDPDMIALVATAARGAGKAGNKDSLGTLCELFSIFRDSYSRVEILGALAVLGKGDIQVVKKLNQFLDEQNKAFRVGTSLNFPVLGSCIAALGTLGDDSSFPFLFSAMTAGYPQTITQETLKALESIKGNFKDFLIDVIRNNPFPEKAAAFRIGAYNEKLSTAERADLARAALEVSVDASGQIETGLRYDAITVLTRLKWTPAAALAIRNFYRVQTDFNNGNAVKERLLEAIACLAAMDTSEAARALALQLGFFNSRYENTGEYDEAIILALINALGELGDKAAFDYLLYISYLNYPDKIQASAREALNRLKW